MIECSSWLLTHQFNLRKQVPYCTKKTKIETFSINSAQFTTTYTNIQRTCTSFYTHLWKHISVVGTRASGFIGNTFTFMEWANFIRFWNLEIPCIWTLSHTILAPGLEPGEFSKGKPRESCTVVFWLKTEKFIKDV